MLVLNNIKKDYRVGDGFVPALKGVSVGFRRSEFVAVLGASGCGKTTLLNIIGGLDRYTDGDLIIDGKSTKDFKAYDWDAYRNHCIGFVFQSYNLIPHLTVLENVELALTLSGESAAERKRKAEEALRKVGLENETNKRPNQLSGGQMQRVAIARAIVNEPQIILADEPTGALDSKTSEQVMDLLKEIAADRLVIMVTHNRELAEQYATRIINLKDGELVGDSAPYTPDETAEQGSVGEIISATGKKKEKKGITRTSMSFFTAFKLSLKNLLTKKGRSIMVSFAGSIGIVGIALVLAISNGFKLYINRLETDTLSNFPITISRMAMDMNAIAGAVTSTDTRVDFPDDEYISGFDSGAIFKDMLHTNTFSRDYVAHVEKLETMKSQSKKARGEALVLDVLRQYDVKMPLLTLESDAEHNVRAVSTESSGMMAQLMGTSSVFNQLLDNSDYVNSQYDVIYGRYPSKYDEIALIVNKYNQLDESLMTNLGLNQYRKDGKLAFEDICDADGGNGKIYKVVLNDGYYTLDGGKLEVLGNDAAALKAAYDGENTITLRVTGILRVNEGAPMETYSSGLVYLPSLTKVFVDNCNASAAAAAQRALFAEGKVYQSMIKGGGDALKNMASGMSGGMSSDSMSGVLSEQEEAELAEAIEYLKKNFLSIYTELSDGKVADFNLVWLYLISENGFMSKDQAREMIMQNAGAALSADKETLPSSLEIFPRSFETKNEITAHLDEWNDVFPNSSVIYTDPASMLSSTMGQMIDIISYVLIAFAAISLIVSSIMIGIITYVSVIERTKEIGVLRSIGARKKDIARVFNAETMLIGFAAGLLGIGVAYLLCIPINAIIGALAAVPIGNMAVLNPLHALAMVIISVVLTLISGLIPSGAAAKKDPVVALRTE